MKIEKIIVKCGDIEIEKQKFHQCKRPISTKSIDINKIVVSSKVSCSKNGFKYFFGILKMDFNISYIDDKKIIPLCIFLPEMSAYRKDFDDTKYI